MKYATLALLQTASATVTLPVDDAVQSLGVLEEGVMSLTGDYAARTLGAFAVGACTGTGTPQTEAASIADEAGCGAKCTALGATCDAAEFKLGDATAQPAVPNECKSFVLAAGDAWVVKAGADLKCAQNLFTHCKVSDELKKSECATAQGAAAAQDVLVLAAVTKYDTDNADNKLVPCVCKKTDADKLGDDPCKGTDAKVNVCGFAKYPEDVANWTLNHYYTSYCGPANDDDTAIPITGGDKFYKQDASMVGKSDSADDAAGLLCKGANQRLFLSSVAMAVSALMMY